MASTKKMDLTKGVIPLQLVQFMTPLAITFITQMLFHAADVIVVGRFARNAEHAVASIGCSGPVVSLLMTIFLGMGAGVSAIVAQNMGAKNYKNVSRAVHSSLALGLVCGVFILTVGFLFDRMAFQLLKVPESIMEDSLAYFRIVLLGIPAVVVYAFGCCVLRSVGKPNLPMVILSISGVVNVVLNIILVTLFDLEILGVAYATVTAQLLSLVLIIGALYRSHGAYRFYFGKLFRIDFSILGKVCYNGFPAGLQNGCFAISNLLVAHANNEFGPGAIAATSFIGFAAGGLINSIANAQHQTTITFTGQNLGANQKERILKGLFWSMTYAMLLGSVLGGLAWLTLDLWLPWCVKNPSEELLAFARTRATLQLMPGFLFMMLDVLSGTLRGLGYSVLPTTISMVGICCFRVFWVFCLFPLFNKEYWILILNFPLSYLITSTILGIALFIVLKKLLKSPPVKEDLPGKN
ncbi:MAG: MATE family efflux transporter [Lentisphaeria bacterium]|nr:MATE family efflux transporter [Lentisphaeria bacterium]